MFSKKNYKTIYTWRTFGYAILFFLAYFHPARAAELVLADSVPIFRALSIGIRTEVAQRLRVHVLVRGIDGRPSFSWAEYNLGAGLNHLEQIEPSAALVSIPSRWKLFWAARPIPGSLPFPFYDRFIPEASKGTGMVVILEQEGRVLDSRFVRFAGGHATAEAIEDAGLTGRLYLPKKEGRHPAILLIGGNPRAYLDPLGLNMADEGLAVFHIDYHALGSSGDCFGKVPIEYFLKALDWLATHPKVDPRRLGIYGISRGAEPIPWIAARRGDLRFAVMATFSAWPLFGGCMWPEAPWTLDGHPLPSLTGPKNAILAGMEWLAGSERQVDRIVPMLRSHHPESLPHLPIGDMRIPTMLVGAGKDSYLPSKMSIDFVCAKLGCNRPDGKLRSIIYDRADHFIHYPPWMPYPCRGNKVEPGERFGICEETAVAADQYFSALLSFISEMLTNGPKDSPPQDMQSDANSR